MHLGFLCAVWQCRHGSTSAAVTCHLCTEGRQARIGQRASPLTPGPPGPYVDAGEAGFLGWREVKAMIDGGAQVTLDKGLKAAYLVQEDQWVSYDSRRTLTWKMQAAAQRGLGGTMVSRVGGSTEALPRAAEYPG